MHIVCSPCIFTRGMIIAAGAREQDGRSRNLSPSPIWSCKPFTPSLLVAQLCRVIYCDNRIWITNAAKCNQENPTAKKKNWRKKSLYRKILYQKKWEKSRKNKSKKTEKGQSMSTNNYQQNTKVMAKKTRNYRGKNGMMKKNPNKLKRGRCGMYRWNRKVNRTRRKDERK